LPALFTDELPIATVLQQAVADHNAGKLIEAERLYRSILARDPEHAESYHYLGVLALQANRPLIAIPYLKAALDRQPENPHYWSSHLGGLMRAGLATEARQALNEAIQRGASGQNVDLLDGRLRSLSAAVAQKVWAPDLTGESYQRVLQRLHETLRPATYLEIGVQTGATLALARCASIGIDPEFRFGNIDIVRRIIAKPSLALYQIPSDDFFARFDPTGLFGAPIDFAFLDGMHRCEFLLRDFFNTERHCRPNSVIALHDCLPLESPMAERDPDLAPVDPRRQGMWTGDVWRTALLLKRRRPDLQITVLDAAPTGLVLITNLDPRNTLLSDNHDQFVAEMMRWSLEQLTLDGYFEEMGVEPESNLRRPEQVLARLRPTA
jgi:hypothetical protein